MSEQGLKVSLKRALGHFRLNVDMEAGNGITGITGASGAGKSTLLQCIAGLVRPHEGRITCDDVAFLDSEAKIFLPPERRQVGYVFQEARLFPHLNVTQNLDYGRRRRRIADATLWNEVVQLLGLERLLTRRPHHLSGGEAQRVALGRALLSAPRLLLMDEPLASLDLKRRREIIPYIEALHEKFEMPTLFVSHNVDELLRLADQLVVMHQGSVVAAGNVADLVNRLDIQALILGESERANDNSTILEGIVTAHDEADGLTEITVAGHRIVMGRIAEQVDARVRLRLHSRDVALATEAPKHLSIQNVIAGHVSGIEDMGPSQMEVTLGIDPGSNLCIRARITRRAARQLALENGKPVWALIKSVALA